MKKVMTLQDIVQSSWGKRFSESFGENLLSAFLHGNCLYEGFDALHESWQISFVLKRAKPSDLAALSKWNKDLKRDCIRAGYFFTEDFLQSKQNDYPLEFLHISQKNVPLFGNSPLQGFVPDNEALKAECKRELENRKLHLIREFTRIQAGLSPMDFFIEAFSEIIPVLYGIYFLRKNTYPQNRDAVFQEFPEFRIQEPALQHSQNIERADAYFDALESRIQEL